LFTALQVTPAVRHVIAFVLILVVVLIAGALMASMLKGAVHAVGLGFIDRSLGGLFGLARGVLLVLVFVLIAGLTALPKHDWWQNSAFGPPLAAAALALKPYLPQEWAERLDYPVPGRPPRAGAATALRTPNGERRQCVES
jgi:membrane protein required for colicin V production